MTVQAETFVVCVGIGNYADPRILNLSKTEKDAKAVAAFYKKGTENVVTVTGRYATKRQILDCLRSQFGRASESDKIVFYFSGHGYPGGFCPYDMSKPEDGLTYAEVVEVMAQSKAKDKMIFADACNSGAIRHNHTSTAPQPGNVLLFLSSRGNESSIESSFLSNGYFTNYLLHGLRGKADADGDRVITAKELFRYVSAGVVELSHDRQHPVMWGNFPDDLVIVKYGKR
ncbi:MAG: caspase family protein [Muribaculaceae bacterium]|nr:caspase family protein [Muribaculaceae bacterium]